MIIHSFTDEGIEDTAIETWLEVANFLIHAIHKIPNNREIDDFKKKLAKFLNKVVKEAKEQGMEFIDNDLRFSAVTFIILDNCLADRSFNESEKIFVELLRTAGNKSGKADVVSLDKFITEKTSYSLEKGYQEWTVLNQQLCLSNILKNNASGKVSSVNNILDSLVPEVIKQKTDLLLNLDFSRIKIKIINEFIEIEKEE